MKVVVLMGGNTSERAVSLSTGSGIAASLRRLGHEVTSIDAAGGRLLEPGKELEATELLPDGESAATSSIVEVPSVTGAEIVFVALHGGPGEDGTLQAVLDLAGRAYTGSGPLASGLAMDKAMSKRLFEHAGVPTPRWLVAPRDGGPPDIEDLRPVGDLPVVVKPNDEGSTVGLTIVERPEQLEEAFHLAAKYCDQVLVEKFIDGRELTVAVIGDETTPVLEIVPEHGIYDYECKYTPGMSRYEVPAQIPDEIAARLQTLSLLASQTLGCRGVTRVDWRLDPDQHPYCLEVNTVPGMTPTSLVPMAAEAMGMSYDDLVARMLELAVESPGSPRRGRVPASPSP